MPNWVRNCISVEEKYSEKLEEISKVGLARFYFPLPEDLKETKAPAISDARILVKSTINLVINKLKFTNSAAIIKVIRVLRVLESPLLRIILKPSQTRPKIKVILKTSRTITQDISIAPPTPVPPTPHVSPNPTT